MSPKNKSTKAEEVRSVRVIGTNDDRNNDRSTGDVSPDGTGVELGSNDMLTNEAEASEGNNVATSETILASHASARIIDVLNDAQGGTETAEDPSVLFSEKKGSAKYTKEASDRVDGVVGSNVSNKVYITSDVEQGLGSTLDE